ncbi:MAG: PD-(D/E)XK nuclease domain-containing protein, partial [Gemmatimonadetes bacterium]|nr:PD-(D/E)XK nuclease domain-containing protein [Gemmatimonadota bacterium]
WQPVLDFLRDALAEQTGIRDYMDGEKIVHGFVAAYLSLSQYFLLHSEYELNKGYADLYLEPFVAQYPDMQFGYVLELKYLKRSESLDESVVAAKVQETVRQLRSYLADPSLPRHYRSVRHIGLAGVVHGWEVVAHQTIDDAAED